MAVTINARRQCRPIRRIPIAAAAVAVAATPLLLLLLLLLHQSAPTNAKMMKDLFQKLRALAEKNAAEFSDVASAVAHAETHQTALETWWESERLFDDKLPTVSALINALEAKYAQLPASPYQLVASMRRLLAQDRPHLSDQSAPDCFARFLDGTDITLQLHNDESYTKALLVRLVESADNNRLALRVLGIRQKLIGDKVGT